jgi:hypothetical protein
MSSDKSEAEQEAVGAIETSVQGFQEEDISSNWSGGSGQTIIELESSNMDTAVGTGDADPLSTEEGASAIIIDGDWDNESADESGAGGVSSTPISGAKQG